MLREDILLWLSSASSTGDVDVEQDVHGVREAVNAGGHISEYESLSYLQSSSRASQELEFPPLSSSVSGDSDAISDRQPGYCDANFPRGSPSPYRLNRAYETMQAFNLGNSSQFDVRNLLGSPPGALASGREQGQLFIGSLPADISAQVLDDAQSSDQDAHISIRIPGAMTTTSLKNILGSPLGSLPSFNDILGSPLGSLLSLKDILGSPPRSLSLDHRIDPAPIPLDSSVDHDLGSPPGSLVLKHPGKRKAHALSSKASTRRKKARVNWTSASSSKYSEGSVSSFHLDESNGSELLCNEASPNGSAFPLNGLYSKARLLGDPWFWANAWGNLIKFSPSEPVDLRILDFYCMSLWMEKRESLGDSLPSCYYLDIRTVLNLLQGRTEMFMKTHLSLPKDSPAPHRPVLLILERTPDSDSPTLLVLNHKTRQLLLLGRSRAVGIFQVPQWLRDIWRAITGFFDWDNSQSESISIVSETWIPGSMEFGQRSASLFQRMLREEWEWDDNGYGRPMPPSFHCSHLMLQQIFVKTLEACQRYSDSWSLLHMEQGNTWSSLNDAIAHDRTVGFLNFSWVKYMLVRLSNVLKYCQICGTHSLSGPLTEIMDEDGLSEEAISDASSQRPCFPPRHRKEGSTEQNNPDQRDDITQNLSTTFADEEDDYRSAPIQSRNDVVSDASIWVFGGDGVLVLPDCWAFWKDRGYRIHSTFFRTLPFDNRSTALDTDLASFSVEIPIENLKPGASTDENCLNLSAQEFIDEAGPTVGTEQSKRVFLRGKERESGTPHNPSKFLVLDLEKDAVSLPEDSVEISVDLDSLIWVVHADKFKVLSFRLLTAPFGERHVGFSTHNFVYVNLVSPPGDEDEVRNPKTRSRENVRLSRIPHAEFGYSGEGERRVNIYIFFPRMIRKSEKTGRYVIRPPLPVEELWFDRVVLPSCNRIFSTEPGFMEYIPTSIAEIRNRSGDRKRHMPVIGGERTNELLRAMQQSILDDPMLLSCFGSFFLVADGRGMKLATKQCIQGPASNRSIDFSRIQEEFSQLDWTLMQDRACGELYLDMGVSYHAQAEEPVVGLYRLLALRESSTALGLKKGELHHMSTFGYYGGLKAEMKLAKKQEHQLVSRLCYCLVFELVRNPGGAEYLCGEKENIMRSDKFIAACKRWEELFHMGATKSFGVRDEIRGLAGAILQLLPHAVDQAKAGLLSNPILWIKSETFFTFISRRFSELLLLHKECLEARRPNYRLMSLIICHMLKHSLITPRLKNSDLSKAFRELRFEEVMMGWGMFFLHDINLKSLKLEGIPEEDPISIRGYKTPFVARPAKEAKPPRLEVSAEQAKKEFPYGQVIPNSRFELLINENADQFLKRPELLEPLVLKNADSELLFRLFTSQIWFLLGTSFYTDVPPVPKDLDSAIEFWTVANIQSFCNNVLVLPTYDGLHVDGFKVKKNHLFGSRKRVFFPLPSDAAKSPLEPFAADQSRYLWSYHEMLTKSTEEQIKDLENDLDAIFSCLQCIPATTSARGRDTIWKTKDRSLLFLINTKFCRVRGITAAKSERNRRAQLTGPAVRKRLHEVRYGPNTFKKHQRQKGNSKKSKRYAAPRRTRAPSSPESERGSSLTVTSSENQTSTIEEDD